MIKFETINGTLCRMVEPEPPREPEYVSVPNPVVSNKDEA